MMQKLKTIFPNFFVQEHGYVMFKVDKGNTANVDPGDEQIVTTGYVPQYDPKPLNNGVAMGTANYDPQAQSIVNDALARYCELCKKGFAHPGLAKNHKRLKHK